MKLYKIQFMKSVTNQLHLHEKKQVPLKILKEMDKQNGSYYFEEYSQMSRRFVRIGVEIENAFRVSIKNRPHISFIHSDYQPGLWFMDPNSDAEIGLNVCGRFAIEAFDNYGTLIAQETIIVFPKTLTLEQYELMQAEIRDLMIAFNTNPASEESNNTRWTRQSVFPLHEFQTLLQKFIKSVEDVLTAPAEILEKRQITMRPESIKRWTPRTLINRQHAIGQQKIKTEVIERSHNIPEHEVIRTMLDNLHSKIQQAYHVELARSQMLENEILSRAQVSSASKKINENGLARAMFNKQNEVEQRLFDAHKKIETLTQMAALLHPYRYEEPLFDVSPAEIEESHLFIHEPRYNAVFEYYEQIADLTPKIKLEKAEFIELMVKSPYLFEVWTLLQLYSECMRLNFIPKSPITDQMFFNFQKHKQLKRLTVRFQHATTGDQIVITYEPEITIANGSLRKPDYYISFINVRNRSCVNHTLDAKYKPYSDPGFDRLLRQDISHSCNRYLQDFSDSVYQIRSASLIHNDAISDSCNWNVRLNNELPYTFAHFNIAPGKTNHLNTYMKRIIHQYNGDYGYCPSCGKMNSGEPFPLDSPYPFKWTYVCDCQEVWVDNTCKSNYKREYHPDHLRGNDVRLLKYAHGNYNKQVRDTWDVHCQVCQRSHQGSLYSSDILGREIEASLEI
ncbi:nuclease domain-containing protein [Exiguobacterium sp. s70]|uniref:nuclease domain-containing protein n=1 Tax=Exiguobacterium sp. s70 TaxID=2751228 RepID=UPI001BEBFCE4|nr:nuclease domain-containing protein [Exiguobacterium sp. s70]